MNVSIATYRAFRPTARILAQLLEARGHTVNYGTIVAGPVVCYGRGYPYELASTLNAETGSYTKYDELERLADMNIPAPRAGTVPWAGCERYLGRRYEHRGGRDIRIANSFDEARALIHAERADFLTELLDVAREWRVWVYRRRHLATYEKLLARPEQHTRFGRNYGNGYSFKLREVGEFPHDVGVYAARAVDAMNLDFGGVDVVETTDGKLYVLEVNAAPGILGDRRRAVNKLAWWVHDWLSKDCPKRRAWRAGDEAEVYGNQD